MTTEGQNFLRAVEDEILGVNTPRVNGKIEKGAGSIYSMLPEAPRKRHADAEAIVVAEKAEHDARVDLEGATKRHAQATAKLQQMLAARGFGKAAQ